ncbi:hypothetical protein TEA_028767 [Camellia sinensis var. sinensis]|uniref:Uncharacterized protein n=1 Tax=Camellia sinensis var. sinensis TaxID=542762 RepID=A0A4S4EUG5_CAMSN|nr:hypothetical protein TEA_028767 [Camellia sinensis var. sinensis]
MGLKLGRWSGCRWGFAGDVLRCWWGCFQLLGLRALGVTFTSCSGDGVSVDCFASSEVSSYTGVDGSGLLVEQGYAYIHEFTRTSMAGKIRRFKDGYMRFWQKISEALPIECAATLKYWQFDAVHVVSALMLKAFLTAEDENHVMDYVSWKRTFGFYYFDEFMDDPATIGNPVAMQRFYAETDIFLFWSYGNSADIMGTRVTELAMDAVKNMGGIVEKVVLQRRFKYFPHVNSQALVCKHFANDSSLPTFPYLSSNLLRGQKPVIKPGDRVLLVHIPGLDFIDAFFGCLRARVLPVPVLPPDPLQRGGQALLKIENIAKSCNAVAIYQPLVIIQLFGQVP